MTDTQFSDILARAGNIDEQFKIAPPHTQEEKDDFCDWIVAYVDGLRRKDRDSDAQKQIVLLELQADTFTYLAHNLGGHAERRGSLHYAHIAYAMANSLVQTNLSYVDIKKLP